MISPCLVNFPFHSCQYISVTITHWHSISPSHYKPCKAYLNLSTFTTSMYSHYSCSPCLLCTCNSSCSYWLPLLLSPEHASTFISLHYTLFTMSFPNIEVHWDSCLISSMSLSITIANKRRLRADPWYNPTSILTPSVTPKTHHTAVSLPVHHASIFLPLLGLLLQHHIFSLSIQLCVFSKLAKTQCNYWFALCFSVSTLKANFCRARHGTAPLLKHVSF